MLRRCTFGQPLAWQRLEAAAKTAGPALGRGSCKEPPLAAPQGAETVQARWKCHRSLKLNLQRAGAAYFGQRRFGYNCRHRNGI